MKSPATTDRDAIHKELAKRLVETRSDGAEWYWLSFVGDSGFLGGCVVLASFFKGDEKLSFFAALRKAHRLGINPGGEVNMAILEDGAIDTIPSQYRHVLLDKETIETKLGGAKRM